jgi:hypothetical protein
MISFFNELLDREICDLSAYYATTRTNAEGVELDAPM